jgi:hypothetical protein
LTAQADLFGNLISRQAITGSLGFVDMRWCLWDTLAKKASQPQHCYTPMGGGQSLTIGLTHLEQFAWVGGMSASVAKREFVLVKGSEMTMKGS